MTDAQAAQIKELRMRGQGYRAIGAAVGLSRDIVRNFCKAKGMDGYARAMALNMQERLACGKACACCGKKSASRGTAGREGSAQTNAGAHGGSCTRRRHRENTPI